MIPRHYLLSDQREKRKNQKFFKLSLVLFIGAVMFAACSDDDSENLPEQNEVVVEPFMKEAKSVSIVCRYHPSKSVAYQLQIGNSVSEKYSKGQQYLKVLNLSPGREYTIKATIYDADQKAIGMSKTNIRTADSSLPDDLMTIPQPIAFEELDSEN